MIINNIRVDRSDIEQLGKALKTADKHLKDGEVNRATFIIEVLKRNVCINLLGEEEDA